MEAPALIVLYALFSGRSGFGILLAPETIPRTREASLDIDLPGFYPAVYPQRVRFGFANADRRGLPLSAQTPDEQAGTLDAHLRN
jgi:hypothetical protein